MGKILQKIIFTYTFFLRFVYRSDPWMDFYAWQLKRSEINARMFLLGI